MTSVVCQVCGTALERSGAVYCPSCETPHHADCWEYLKGCSTYGCASVCYDALVVREHPVAGAIEVTGYLGSLPLVAAGGKAPVLYFGAGGEEAQLLPGESAVQVSDEVLEGIGLDLRSKVGDRSRDIGVPSAMLLVAAAGFFNFGPPMVGALCFVIGVVLALHRAEPPLPPHRAWLIKTGAGRMGCQVTWDGPRVAEEEKHSRLDLVPNPSRRGRSLMPTLIRLNFHEVYDLGGRGPPWREFVLQLHFRDQRELDLLPPFQAPQDEQSRAEFLRKIAKARETGRQLSAFWSIPYEESFAKGGLEAPKLEKSRNDE